MEMQSQIPILISVISSLISFGLLIFAYLMYREAKKESTSAKINAKDAKVAANEANRLADEANNLSKKTAKEALLVSEEANRLREETLNFAKEERQKLNRPKMEIIALTLDLKELDFYSNNPHFDEMKQIKSMKFFSNHSGKNIATYFMGLKKLLLLNPNNRLRHNKTDEKSVYLLANMCAKYDIDKSGNNKFVDDVMLAYGILNITVNLGSNQIHELKVVKAYYTIGSKKIVINEEDISGSFRKPKSPLNIKIAHASLNNSDALIKFHALNGFKGSALENETVIDFLKPNFLCPNFLDGGYIKFDEMAYLLKCITEDKEIYHYSLYLKNNYGKLDLDWSGIEPGDSLFEKGKSETNELEADTEGDARRLLNSVLKDLGFVARE